MPNPSDIKSLEDDEDPDDILRMQLDQGQGNNLAGAPQPPGQAGMAPSPNVPGPLAALAPKVKPHIRLKNTSPPPKVKKIKPKIRLKSTPGPSSALQNFLNTISPNPGS